VLEADKKALAEKDVVEIGIAMCNALVAIHDKHILHRDIKCDSRNCSLIPNFPGTNPVQFCYLLQLVQNLAVNAAVLGPCIECTRGLHMRFKVKTWTSRSSQEAFSILYWKSSN
jgi:serine/threonine protein kinase